MNTIVRTTITLPANLYESLRLQAFAQKTSFSGIIRRKLSGDTTNTEKTGLDAVLGKFSLKGGTKKVPKLNRAFINKLVYEEPLKRKMSF